MSVFVSVLAKLVNIYSSIIFVYCILTWFPHSEGFVADLFRVLGRICDPFLSIFRKLIPPMGGVDFSPIVAILVLQMIVQLFSRLL